MRYTILFFGVMFLIGCEENPLPNTTDNETFSKDDDRWGVDTTDMTGTSINNTFPVTTNPSYSIVDDITLTDEARVLVFKVSSDILVYPISFLGIEVLNDYKDDEYFAVTYCPLTQSSLIWKRIIGGDTLTFAASGVLYRNNLVPYDVETESLWSQMLFRGIHGKHIHIKPLMYRTLETNWGHIKKYFPEALVFISNIEQNQNTYKSEEIAIDNESSYEENEDLYKQDERVYGIFFKTNDLLKHIIYTKSYNDFSDEVSIDKLNGLIVVSSKNYNFVVSFRSEGRQFSPIQNQFPVILKDENGINYDVFGRPVSDIDEAAELESPAAYSALWWAWSDFYDNFVKF